MYKVQEAAEGLQDTQFQKMEKDHASQSHSKPNISQHCHLSANHMNWEQAAL